MSKNRNAKKTPGYRPKGAAQAGTAAAANRNKLLLGLALIVAAVAIGGYWWSTFNERTGKESKTTTGLKYEDVVVGSGESPRMGSEVTVHYTGTLLDGTKFDSSVDRGQPFTFRIGLGQVIRGWDEGVMSMKVGGKRKLIIPPDLGYGSTRKGKIPPNSTLLFDVELLGVK